MNFHDEVVEPDDLDLPSPQKNPTEREIQMAGKLVEVAGRRSSSRTSTRTPTATRCSRSIKRKAKGEEIETPEEPEREEHATTSPAALEASL